MSLDITAWLTDMKYSHKAGMEIWKNKLKPQHMGFKMISRGGGKTERWMWHLDGHDWSMTIEIPRWKSSLFRFMHDSPPPQIEFPADADFTLPGGSGRVKLDDVHELHSALAALKDPMVLMAGATPVVRRMLARLQ